MALPNTFGNIAEMQGLGCRNVRAGRQHNRFRLAWTSGSENLRYRNRRLRRWLCNCPYDTWGEVNSRLVSPLQGNSDEGARLSRFSSQRAIEA